MVRLPAPDPMDIETFQKEPKTVLLVDDDETVRRFLCEGIRNAGYHVVEAASAEAAEDALGESECQLVLSDIDMPGTSGIELLRKVKRFDPDLDVIMVTGMKDAETAVQAIREGASDYLTKPVQLNNLCFVIERTLERRRLVLENRAYGDHLEELVARRTSELERAYESTLQALVTALDFRDNETQGHSVRVVEYAVEIATAMRVTEPALTWIRKGAILHDVGKIGIPDAILHKRGRLTPDEWAQMKKHPEMGYQMLEHIDFLKPALEIVLCHQERYDGTGYPRGLKGDGIPIGARIFSVVDAFDAMTSDRPYRPAMTIDAARAEIESCGGSQFDPDVVRAFMGVEPGRWSAIRRRVQEDLDGWRKSLRR